MINIFGWVPRFVKDHASWILTGLGTAGFIGTVSMAAKEAPVAREALWKAAADKTAEEFPEKDISEIYCMIDDGKLDPVDLTLWEKIKTVTPHYIRTILFGTGSLGCFWGGQIVNMKTQAGLLAMYGALAAQFNQYREVIRDEYGEEADRNALILARAEVERLREMNAKLMAENGPFLYGIATLPGVIFEAEPKDIQEAFMHFNRNLVLRGENIMSELYEFIGVPESVYDAEAAATYGYNQYENEVTWGCGYVDFEIMEIETPRRTIRMIYMNIPPYKLDVDYGFQGEPDSCDMIYPGYNTSLAIEKAKQICQHDIIQITHPKIYHPVFCMG